MSGPNDGRTGALLAQLGAACWRRPWQVIALWALAVVAGGIFSAQASQRLLSGSGDLAGTMSSRVGEILAREFDGGEAQSLVVVVRRRDGAPLTGGWQEIEDRVSERLANARGVSNAAPAGWLIDDAEAASRHGLVTVVLKGTDTLASEQQIESLRETTRATIAALGTQGRALDWAITGRAAISHDINVFSTRDTARAELRALPLAFAVLLLAFGSLLAAGLPLALAVAARTVGLAVIVAIAGFAEVSNLAQSIATMISLALGIDYSLFVYHRFRELLRSGVETGAALRGAMAQSGQVVLYSGVAVAIGMGALLVTDSLQVRSIGLAGAIAVVMSVAAALTLLPALLAVLPGRLRQVTPARPETSSTRWSRWGEWLVRHPWPAIGGSLAIFAVLASPIAQTRLGFPEDVPAELESTRGLAMLQDAGVKGLVSPLQILVSDLKGKRLVTAERVPSLVALIEGLERDPRVSMVQAPSLRTSPQLLPLPVDPDHGMVSRDKARVLLRVIPATTADLASVRALARSIAVRKVTGAEILVGGQAQYFNDFETEMVDAFPVVLSLVLALSGAVLLVMLRAPLAAAKAIALNLLSVAAGYGTVVWVFQLGHGAWLFGLSAPAEVVTPSVPIVIFAVLFGLSMDYEIFLISRIRALYLDGAENSAAIVAALADTGAVISQAALIMALVFGAFAFSKLLLIQMIGLGLAIAIVADALVIRSILGPALMAIAGRWNWWPYSRPATER